MINSKSMILLRALLKSTSSINTLRYSSDKKIKNKIIGGYIGMAILYAMFLAFSIFPAIGMGIMGMTDAIPAMSALGTSVIAFTFSVFRANGYLFRFKEYDMLVSMPFEIRSIVGCKILTMYIANLPWYVCIFVPMMIGYGVFARPPFYTYFVWIILSILIPVIPTVLASFVGALIARIGASFKYKKAVQTILTFVFIMCCFFSRFVIEAILRNKNEEAILNNMKGAASNMSKYYFPADWFAKAVNDSNVLCMLGIIALSAAIFYGFYVIVSRFYRQVNSSLAVGVTKGKSKNDVKKETVKKRGVISAVAFKEYKRLMGSTVYLTNCCFGEVAVMILAIASLIFKPERIVKIVTQDAPIPVDILIPAIPFIVFFFIGMVSTTCCSPSLEGNNYWIVQSLPISRLDLYKGKMHFNMQLKTPFAVIASVLMGIAWRVDAVYILLFVVMSIVLVAYSTTFGMIMGLKFIKLDWKNEIEVVKQGAAVAIYLFPNVIITMGLTVAVVALGHFFNGKIALLIITVVYAVLAYLFYLVVKGMAKKG